MFTDSLGDDTCWRLEMSKTDTIIALMEATDRCEELTGNHPGPHSVVRLLYSPDEYAHLDPALLRFGLHVVI